MSLKIEAASNKIPFSAYLLLGAKGLEKEVILHFSKKLTEASIAEEKVSGNFKVAEYLCQKFKISEYEDKEVQHWVKFVTAERKGTIEEFDEECQKINWDMQTKTYLVGYDVGLADFFYYEYLSNSKHWKGYLARFGSYIPHLARYFSNLESQELFIHTNKILSLAAKKNVTSKDILDIQEAMKPKAEKSPLDDVTISGDIPHAKVGQVVTRFPPEPSGYLHVGHAKAALFNYFIAKKYKGKLVFRFDDTNPAKEKDEYAESILADLKRLNITYDYFTYTSDSFPLIQDLGEKLIKEGKAYIDDTDIQVMRDIRAEGKESPCRSRTVEENMILWSEMLKGTPTGFKCCVRAKIDPASTNLTMRDPIMFRCKNEVHPRLGDKYKCYPTYDFACPIVDSIEGVTHALRTSEYNDRNFQYYWFIDALGIRKPHIHDFSRLNLTYTLMSKRKLQKLVDDGIAESWSDPRFPTIQGLLRRGLNILSLYKFVSEQCGSRSNATLDVEKLWSINRHVIDPIVPRYSAVKKEKASILEVSGLPSLKKKKVPRHPQNESMGKHEIIVSEKMYLDIDDAKDIKEKEEITLRHLGNVIITEIKENSDGSFSFKGEFNKDGSPKSTEKKLTWLAITDELVSAKLVYFDHLITKPKVEAGDELSDLVNPKSKWIVEAFVDSNLKDLKKSESIQIERVGYFICDSKFDNLVLFNTPDGHKEK